MNPFGTVAPPPGVNQFSGGALTGLPIFVSVMIRTLIVIAGLYALLNFVFAGYSFLSGAGDPKRIQDAWSKIWQTVIGLVVVAGSFIIAAIIGMLLFGDANALIGIRIFGP